MPGTTRYSATFDRTYEEEDRVDPAPPPNARRSRSLSWQASSGLDGRPYTPLGGRPPTQRSSSTDNGPKAAEHIPTRTVAKTAVKTHNNPFQFVKVGTCPLYKKAEEQLKKAKEVKKPDVLKEEEEEWQSNLDSWKSRRRKMSEDVFRRQEEMKQLELEEQIAQLSQKKTKTFSEMVESRAHRGRALSLCLISSPLDFQNWEFESSSFKNGSCSTFSGESEENSTVNSEDEGVSLKGRLEKTSQNDTQNKDHRTNGDARIEQNGTKLDNHNGDYNKLSDISSNNLQAKPKEGSYIDSGLESISSSHRAGDTPDSGSDFSQDSTSSIDCDSPRTGINILEEFNSKPLHMTLGKEITIKLSVNEKGQDFGFTFLGGKDEGQVLIASILDGSKAQSSGIHLGDQILAIDGKDVSSKKHIEIASLIQKGREKGEISLILSRHSKGTDNGTANGFSTNEKLSEKAVKPSKSEKQNSKSESQKHEKSIESENEMYVDDFEELKRQSELMAVNSKSDSVSTNSQANGNTSFKDIIPNNTSLKNSSKLKEIITNGTLNKNEQKSNSEINNENQKKSEVKVKTRKKGVYALNVPVVPNQISKDGISSNSLFPLSPVTELPSPSEEIKTVTSTLSSNLTSMTSVAEREKLSKELPNETEIKLKSPNVKVFNKSTNNASDMLTSSNISSDASKNNSSEKCDSKTESLITPSSPTKNKEKNALGTSQDEKSKMSTGQKKIKVKVKKASTSDNASSASPQVAKEVPTNSSSLSGVPTVSVAKEKSVKELKSTSQVEDKKAQTSNEIKITESSKMASGNQQTEIIDNIVSDGVVTSQDKILVKNSSSNHNENKVPKGDEKRVSSMNAITKATKSPEDVKLKPDVTQKTDKSKSKEAANNQVETSVIPNSKATGGEGKTPVTNTIGSSNNVVNQIPKTDTKNESKKSSLSVTNKPIETPQVEKPRLITHKKKDKSVTKENILSSEPAVLSSNGEPATENKIQAITSSSNVENKVSKSSVENECKKSLTTSSKQSGVLQDDKKSVVVKKKEKTELKGSTSENSTSVPSKVSEEVSTTSNQHTSDMLAKNLVKEKQQDKRLKSNSENEKKQEQRSETTKADSSQTREGADLSTKASKIKPDVETTASQDKIPVTNSTASVKILENQIKKSDMKNESIGISSANSNQLNIPQEEKSKLNIIQRKEKTKSKENSIGTSAVSSDIKSASSKDKTPITNVTASSNNNGNQLLRNDKKIEIKNSVSSPVGINRQPSIKEEKPKVTNVQQKEKTVSKNANSQKVNTPAKQIEEIKNSNVDSLNIVFQSEPKNTDSENQPNNIKNSESTNNKKAPSLDLVPDIPPVEKVAEEMEKLILEQLEEEERAKELTLEKNAGSPEHLLTAPPKLAEPPKEKPPPPPPASSSEGVQKDASLKRVNSTKRIKKEIHKRRSNFLGIDNADENVVCNEPSIPPPPALEEILKAEMELNRQSRLKIENAVATERLTLEEKEIIQKEREIIESVESEERQKLMDRMEAPNNDVMLEDDRIQSLKNERKRIETERLMTEEQQFHLIEEKQLREREELIRKQEANKSTVPKSAPSVSKATKVPNISQPSVPSLSTGTQSSVSISGTSGDGKSLTSNSTSENKPECDEKSDVPQKPAVPPKPLKKKEAIRKERERLRQEQEALQREREEHRRKLLLEQEELMKHQKSHAPDAPVSRLGPLPPLVQPSLQPQLTSTMNTNPNARESASFPSRSHHGASNGAAGSMNTVELMGPPVVRQNRMPASRKAVQNEAWGQQKMPSVRKQNHDSLTESRYNQNHWLIQEAEMRRITELKERQRASQLSSSQTHLAEDDVCSNTPRVPVIPPTHNQHLNYPVQDKVWNYGQSNLPVKKYPPAVVKEPLHTIYPRETVSQQPPTKPSRVVPMERQEQMLSVSGRKRCSHCNEELGRGAAMIIESLQLYYHIHCFQCCVCQAQLGNGSCGTDVRVRNNKLHCHNCYSNDEAGLKFSQV